MRYLDRLKGLSDTGCGAGELLENPLHEHLQNLQNPSKGSFDGFVGRGEGTFPKESGRRDVRPTTTRWSRKHPGRYSAEVAHRSRTVPDQVLADDPAVFTAEPLTERTADNSITDRSCLRCPYRKRPGMSDPGYCGGGRDDLPGAYGLHHPLRQLPEDGGASCTIC